MADVLVTHGRGIEIKRVGEGKVNGVALAFAPPCVWTHALNARVIKVNAIPFINVLIMYFTNGV